MKLTVIGTDMEGNPIDELTNPETVEALKDFLTEVYSERRTGNEANEIRIAYTKL